MPRRSTSDGPTPGSAADLAPDADPVDVARAIVLRQLTAGPRTRSQLEQALKRRDVPDSAAGEVLDRFAELGYVDDEAFARAWVDSRHAGRGLARRALTYELRQRGVSDDVAREAVDTLDADAERETARALVRRRLASLRGQPADVAARRLAGMLARKGYPSGLAFAVIREELQAAASHDGDGALPGSGPHVIDVGDDHPALDSV
jgi:regulatory protein